MIYVLLIIYLLFHQAVSWSLAVSMSVVLFEFVPLPIAFGIAVGMGVIEDVVYMRPIGISSFVLITCLFLSWLLKTYYQTYSIWWMLVISILGQLVMNTVGHASMNLGMFVGQLITVTVIYFIRSKMFDRDGVYVGI